MHWIYWHAFAIIHMSNLSNKSGSSCKTTTTCNPCSFNVPQVPFNGEAFRNIKVFACLSWMLTDNVSFIVFPLKHIQSIYWWESEKKCIWFCYICMWHSLWYQQYWRHYDNLGYMHWFCETKNKWLRCGRIASYHKGGEGRRWKSKTQNSNNM